MARSHKLFTCSNCAYESSKWQGKCPNCNEFNTFEESEQLPGSMQTLQQARLLNLKQISKEKRKRISTGYSEIDRVLGGGLVPGEVVLLSGEPGIGKSTLLLQLVAGISKKNFETVYISAEESAEQIGLRGERIVSKPNEHLMLLQAFELNSIMAQLKELQPGLVVVDSIQTVYTQESLGLPGSISQIKNVSSKLVKYAKENNIAVIIVGHITKQGSIAGPKLLEHLVDAVLQLEGDEKRGFRLLRSFKNRFGSTNEVGIFEMTEKGMVEVADPSQYFLEDIKESKIGVCPGVVLEGNRPLIIEVQALTVSTPFSLPRRIAEGISKSKLELLAAIISKYGKIDLSSRDIYINIAGGIKVKDPALDLAVVLAILSSLKEKPLPPKLVAYGEVSLTGVIRKVVRNEQRDREVKRLGYNSFRSIFKGVRDIRGLTRKF
ncbi:MAG: DNA repair protein RadA [Candidatus Dojkabacteria bacterium]